jgi:L-ascorbate metabolism protein UlaG (beta-lactamase superfamily)
LEGDDSTSTRESEPSVLRITWLGHSTVLLELDGTRLLTDPVFRNRLAHLRRVAAPIDVGALAEIDAVLVSHLHYDHLDVPSLERLDRSVRLVLPTGGGELLRRRGFVDIAEVGVDDEVQVGVVAVQATAAAHDGRRHPLGPDAPALGFLVKGSARVYFAGDTDLFDGMRTLASDLEVALLPVAGWGPRLPSGHLDPLQAAEAVRLLRPRLVIPIHWGTYRRIGLSRDAAVLRAPAESFVRHVRELAPEVDVRLLPVGESLEITLPRADPTAPGRGSVQVGRT